MPDFHRREMLRFAAGTGAGLMLGGPAWAQPSGQEGDWSGDVAVLKRAWNALHPGLHRYAPPAEIEDRLDSLSRAWATPAGFRDRFLALTRVTASVRCGHTYPSPHNSPDEIVARLYADRALLPFKFRWIDGRMVVTNDDSEGDLFPRGSVITALNGVDSRHLLASLVPLARADGSNDGKRVSLMEVRGLDRYETFDIHLPLVLPLRDQARFRLADGREVEARLLTRDERDARRLESPPASNGNPWKLEHLPDGVARLTMASWSMYNSDFAWEPWLAGVMDDLAGSGARGLIIDLRSNEGGNDCGNVILSRLIERPLPLSRDQNWTRYQRVPDDLRPFLTTWDRSFYDWSDQAVPSVERPGYWRLQRSQDEGDAASIEPAGRRFGGRVAVLCDASNSSATFSFCQAVKDSGVATLIGQTTGGNRRGINGGAFFFLRLPESGIVVDLPLIASFPATPQPDAAIDPDIPVKLTLEDYVDGRDRAMEVAVEQVGMG